ncbi:MAG: hypothetical protein K2P71_04570, partial [Lachnospiraceae bacterium]|nr:hypothetical protein [Lachnospiraceae bacterium]
PVAQSHLAHRAAGTGMPTAQPEICFGLLLFCQNVFFSILWLFSFKTVFKKLKICYLFITESVYIQIQEGY